MIVDFTVELRNVANLRRLLLEGNNGLIGTVLHSLGIMLHLGTFD
jgi:hypothetical protein